MSSDHKFKLAKDSLVSSLFELSKAASQSASSVLDFYHCIQDENYDLDQAFLTLQQSLSLLGQGTNQLEAVVNQFGDKVGFRLVDQASSSLDPNSALTAGGKKKKTKKDPFAPKKPLTIFFAYTAYVRDSIIQERKDKNLTPLTQIELTQTISQMWRELDDEQKDKWKMSYNHELEVYNKRKEEYLESKRNGILIDFNKAPEPKANAVSTKGTEDDSVFGSKRSHDDDAEKKKKKKKAKKAKKEKKAAAAAAAAAAPAEEEN
ncbi:hypothetical protein HANVADRAFT_36803 [Hanseniaspora valbyensis NRRL Y-1626]|uniref:HMG box domain-containing protein n=1 Tax=Hanseniaspora valbyensis NRRL Y-1626 TaxID=766949 RepID=A0A1B7TIF2_9ASCO|nr:hypothetical protein HANVADRAFT_36803 [Hanseniaspora valbyensis NRRL Y-1626]